jgi:RNA polymerase sigma factor (sigma-70 family)
MMYGRGMSIHEIESIAWMGVMRCCRNYKTPSNASFATYAINAIRNEIIYDYVFSKADKRNPEHGKIVHLSTDEGRGGKKSEAHLHWGMFASSGYSLTDDVDDEDRLQIIRIRVRFALDEMKNNRDRQVVMMRFGIPDGEPKTLEQIGDRIGLTKERVRQLEMRALSVLKPKLESIWNVI